VKDSGKAKLDLTNKDLPSAFLRSPRSLSASIVVASFGSSTGYNRQAFTLAIDTADSTGSPASDEKPLRYGKLPEIHHIFRADPKNPNILISLFFSGAVLATLPILLGTVRSPFLLRSTITCILCTKTHHSGSTSAATSLI
jgi:oligosaccharyltransferase complex subunit delta (ribophorin II)